MYFRRRRWLTNIVQIEIPVRVETSAGRVLAYRPTFNFKVYACQNATSVNQTLIMPQ